MKEALKLALDFVEDVYLGEWRGPTERQEEVISAIKEALAQPEQEPVKNFEVCEIGARFDGAAQQHIPFVVIEFEPVPVNSEYDAKGWKDRDLFISDIKNTPPQRTWVGLTEEDMDWLHANTPCIEGNYGYRFIRAIEAKLKEKNT